MSGIDDPCEGEDEIEEDANPTPDQNGNVRLASAVLQRVANSTPGFRPWYSQLPDDVRAELAILREQWRNGNAGGLQKRALARAIIDELKSRGLPVAGVQGVEHWLGRAN